jgi:hypothetical protein
MSIESSDRVFSSRGKGHGFEVTNEMVVFIDAFTEWAVVVSHLTRVWLWMQSYLARIKTPYARRLLTRCSFSHTHITLIRPHLLSLLIFISFQVVPIRLHLRSGINLNHPLSTTPSNHTLQLVNLLLVITSFEMPVPATQSRPGSETHTEGHRYPSLSFTAFLTVVSGLL